MSPSPLRPIKLIVQVFMGMAVGAVFGSLQHMSIGTNEPQHIAVMIFIILSYCYLVKTLITSWCQHEYYEPYEHLTGLLSVALTHSIVYHILA